MRSPHCDLREHYANPLAMFEVVRFLPQASPPRRRKVGTLTDMLVNAATRPHDKPRESVVLDRMCIELRTAWRDKHFPEKEPSHDSAVAIAAVCQAMQGDFARRGWTVQLFARVSRVAADNHPVSSSMLRHGLDAAALFVTKRFPSMLSHVSAGVLESADHSVRFSEALVITAETTALLDTADQVAALCGLWGALALFPSIDQLEALQALVKTSRFKFEILHSLNYFALHHYGCLPRVEHLRDLRTAIELDRSSEATVTQVLFPIAAEELSSAIGRHHRLETLAAFAGAITSVLSVVGSITAEGAHLWGWGIGGGLALATTACAFMYRTHWLYSRADGFKLPAIWERLTAMERDSVHLDVEGRLHSPRKIAASILKKNS